MEAPSSLAAEDAEGAADERALRVHRDDSQTLMLYICLLIVTVLITWSFKHRNFRFVHETGVTLIVGGIVGVIMWAVDRSHTFIPPTMVQLANSSYNWSTGAPSYIQLNHDYNETAIEHQYVYELIEVEEKTSMIESAVSLQGLYAAFAQKTIFSPETFINILLPPIIFNAGYQMKKKQFFRNIGTILVFALLGTLISAVFVGYFMYFLCKLTVATTFSQPELLYFGALISATDPVTILTIFSDLNVERDLFALVMGESVLNDAVAIVLANTVKEYIPQSAAHATVHFTFANLMAAVGQFLGVFFGSLVLGALVGCANALFTKFTKIREHPLLESSLFLLMSYLSFLVAESANMTGIVAVLFCGMCQAHYTFNNLSEQSQMLTKEFFSAANFLAESFVFMYIGVSLFNSPASHFNFFFVLWAILAVVLARMLFVYTLSFLLNLRRKPKIPMNHQHMLVWAGLRGAIAYALSFRNLSTPQRQYIYTATSIIVVITVLINGGLTRFVIDKLKVRYGIVDAAPVPTDGEEVITPTSAAYNPWDKSFLPRKWYNFDVNFMKPFLTNARPSLMETLPSCLIWFGRIFTTKEQMLLASQRLHEESPDSARGPNGSFTLASPTLNSAQPVPIQLSNARII